MKGITVTDLFKAQLETKCNTEASEYLYRGRVTLKQVNIQREREDITVT